MVKPARQDINGSAKTEMLDQMVSIGNKSKKKDPKKVCKKGLSGSKYTRRGFHKKRIVSFCFCSPKKKKKRRLASTSGGRKRILGILGSRGG